MPKTIPPATPFVIKAARKPYIPGKVSDADVDEAGRFVSAEATRKVKAIAEEGVRLLKEEPTYITANIQALEFAEGLQKEMLARNERVKSDLQRIQEISDEIAMLEENIEGIKESQSVDPEELKKQISIQEKEIELIIQDRDLDEFDRKLALKPAEKTLRRLQDQLKEATESTIKTSAAEAQLKIDEFEAKIENLKEELFERLKIEEPEDFYLNEFIEETLDSLREELAEIKKEIPEIDAMVKRLDEKLAPTRAKLRRDYLIQREIDSKRDFFVVEHEGKLRILSIYKGEKHNKHLGAGAFGKVKIAQDEEGNFWAIKYMRAPQTEDAQREHETLAGVDQTIGFTQFTSRKHATRYGIEHGTHTNVIVMKLAPGIPLSKVKNDNTSDVRVIRRIAAVTDAITSLHEQRIIHFDLKPDNILYDAANGVATIIDYGLAVILPKNMKGISLSGFAGTPLYAPPEMREKMFQHMFFPNDYKKERYLHTQAFDIHTAGILIAESLGLVKSSYYRKVAIPVEEPEDIEEGVKEKKAVGRVEEEEFGVSDKTPAGRFDERYQYKGEYLEVVELDSDDFKENMVIKDPVIRRKIVEMLHEMTAENPADRPSMAKFKELLSEIQRGFVVKQDFIQTAVVNLDDYKKLNDDDKKILKEKLKTYDEVILISSKTELNVDLSDSIYIRKEFEAENILVREDILYGSTSVTELLDAIPEWDKKSSNERISSYTYLSVENKKLQQQPIDAVKLRDEVLAHLEKDRSQMGLSVDQKRSISEAIRQIKTGPLTISFLKKTIEELQTKTRSKDLNATKWLKLFDSKPKNEPRYSEVSPQIKAR